LNIGGTNVLSEVKENVQHVNEFIFHINFEQTCTA